MNSGSVAHGEVVAGEMRHLEVLHVDRKIDGRYALSDDCFAQFVICAQCRDDPVEFPALDQVRFNTEEIGEVPVVLCRVVRYAKVYPVDVMAAHR